ncbi:MAG TPA: hypothetical protein VFH39_02515, partial [Candidatus Saccharimonadales bacterium]|nr:hypothetical protein [Candidatus Saccharimonadales bacterium]
MQNDKKRRGIANEALTPDEEKELESRVDQMMQLERERADKSVPAEATDMPKQPEATADTSPVDVPSAPPLATAESVEASPAEPTDTAP